MLGVVLCPETKYSIVFGFRLSHHARPRGIFLCPALASIRVAPLGQKRLSGTAAETLAASWACSPAMANWHFKASPTRDCDQTDKTHLHQARTGSSRRLPRSADRRSTPDCIQLLHRGGRGLALHWGTSSEYTTGFPI